MTLADEILEALKRKANSRERTHQIGLGPSEFGHCREYVRNVMIGAPRQPNDEWPAAAEIGTLIGDYMESAVGEYMGAQTQVPVTTRLPNGLTVRGTADMVMPDRNCVVDCKSKSELAQVRRDGPSIDNLIQISIYALGLVQGGVLQEGATAHLVYVDRSGKEQVLHEVTLSWERILAFIDLCVERLTDVITAQEHVDQGEVEWARALRDKTRPFCYHPSVMCPFRDLCWKGSEWKPSGSTLSDEETEIVHGFVQARAEQKEAEELRKAYREALKGVSGVTETGWSVVWSDGDRALYVTQVD